jgi:ligand-binding sensor protein
VARTGVQKVDELLRGKADIALLLSPQGVVFASSRKEWIGHLSGTPTPERLQAIRELKQFGNLFEKRDPPVLPMSAEPGVCEVDGSSYAVASAKVQWNDPMGDWSLVLMEDLTRTVPLTERLRYGAGAGFIVLLIGVVLIRLLRSHSDQLLAGEQLAAYSSQQQKAGTRKIELSEAGLQMQQVQQVDELLPGYFSAAHRMFGAFQGVAYLVDRVTPDMMVLAGSYACAELPPAELAMGEGLLGQCAVEKRSQLINTTAAGFATIRSGLGETSPAALLLAPIMLHDRLLGVVELALLHKPDSAEQEQFADMVGLLAMNIEILERTAQTKEMLSAAVAAEQEMARLADIERFNRLAQGREQRILELKHEINALAVEAGKMPPYVMTLVEIVDDSDHPDDRTDLTLDTSTLQLSDLVDLTDLQNLFTAFCESVGIASAIIDLEGTVLVSANWQRACTGFHRVNTESCKLCIESDTELALQLQTGQDFTMYTCKNGMTDAASPIVVEGRHLANVFIGQFHLGPPDLDFFRQQALHFGYPEAEYLLAVSEGPVVDERRMPVILGFLSGFARMIGTMSLARYRADAAQAKLQEQAELLRRERLAAMSLAEDAEAFRQMKQQGVPL